jgi:redox-sensitive bicupin YhaK (pirin superfamily)
MAAIRKIKHLMKSIPTLEGAGVHLKRAFGFHQKPNLDPFLLLDDFHGTEPGQYIKGFPWHPHRGIETITYLLQGSVEHGDSLGNKGIIHSGDVQWMTAGSGIVHQEMPKGREDGVLWGLQLWANLPATQKMMQPRYRDVTREQIPTVTAAPGVKAKILAGELQGIRGPVRISSSIRHFWISKSWLMRFYPRFARGLYGFCLCAAGQCVLRSQSRSLCL